MKILIAGCGYTGCALAEQMQRQGHEVWAIARSPRNLPGVHWLVLDLSDPASADGIPDDFDATYFTASAAGIRSEEAYRAIYLQGLNTVMQAAERSPNLKRFFFTSSTAVYGQQDGAWVDEDSATEPPRFNGQIMLQAEEQLLNSNLPATVVRLSGIYGPGRDRMIRRVRDREAPPATPPDYLNHIHRDDAAGLLRFLLSLETIESLYLGTDSAPAEYPEVYPWLAEKLKVPCPELPSHYRPGKRCSNKKLLTAGYLFLYPSWREGYASLIQNGNH